MATWLDYLVETPSRRKAHRSIKSLMSYTPSSDELRELLDLASLQLSIPQAPSSSSQTSTLVVKVHERELSRSSQHMTLYLQPPPEDEVRKAHREAVMRTRRLKAERRRQLSLQLQGLA